jgi:Protein of unknown function (DUF1569)
VKTLWHPDSRAALRQRIDRLTPATQPLWGRMNAGEMVLHCTAGMRLGLGELPAKPRNSVFRYWPLKHLFVYWVPFPKSAPAPREVVTRGKEVGDWAESVAALHATLERFAERNPRAAWPVHPVFGPLTGKAWGALGWRHLDHHLRQFGV